MNKREIIERTFANYMTELVMRQEEGENVEQEATGARTHNNAIKAVNYTYIPDTLENFSHHGVLFLAGIKGFNKHIDALMPNELESIMKNRKPIKSQFSFYRFIKHIFK